MFSPMTEEKSTASTIHLVLFIVAMAAGLMFASVSTYDFAQHLDRQVHDIHCSFVPGLADAAGKDEQTGCQVTMMSPYSSVFRRAMWGGLPVSLPAMGLFAFLLFRGFDTLGRRGLARRRSAGFLLVASALPVAASIVMGTIAIVELDTACKLCIGIYGASLIGILAAGLAYATIRRDSVDDGEPAPSSGAVWLGGLAQMGVFVLLPALVWKMAMPDFSRYVGTCGRLAELPTPETTPLVAMDDNNSGTPAIEVFDPLCKSCRALEERLAASGLDRQIHRKAVLFPLDDSCNWMVEGATMHPGACTVSEAILCAADGGSTTPRAVMDWAFANQEPVMAAEQAKEGGARAMVVERFPDLASCVGSDAVRNKIVRSLRWSVKASIPVLTPQLYVAGAKLCDEDTDLGLEYSLSKLLEREGGGRR
jgi:hypothetical protein